MSSFTNNAREAFVSIPNERSDWPILAIYELIDSSELGTEANPIVIGDDPTPFGSASNPIVIHIDEDCGHKEAEQLGSDADTEIMATPEFWEILIDESLPASAHECADVNFVSVLPPTTQLVCEAPEEPRIVEQNCPRLDNKAIKDRALKVIEDHSVALYGQTSQAETDRNKYEDNDHPVCGMPDTFSITDQSQTQETPHSTTKCIASESPHGSYGRWSAKRKLSDADGVSLEPGRSERLIKRAR
ncbi:hypothetical protein PDIG_06310 [Penicillium digitatum PHI26]|uniref:Uncharacterized protein n=1 Tax=Penicillium digitatum (strain PHI26 / CECT 20796) TaxID=1170229 RepID=K9GDE4_PEND2|nr:hypothetical protein PDIG_06310 [Penicillium digitatum PHI26]